MARVFRKWRQLLKVSPTMLLVGVIVLTSLPIGKTPDARAEEESPYHVTEFPIHVAPGIQGYPILSGKWVLWRDKPLETSRITGHNMETGTDFDFSGTSSTTSGERLEKWPLDVANDMVLAVVSIPHPDLRSEYGVFGFRLPSGERFTIAPFRVGPDLISVSARTDGNTVVWAEGGLNTSDIHGYDLVGQRPITVTNDQSRQQYPVVSGNYIVWLDNRNTLANSVDYDIYGYNISTKGEFRITTTPEQISGWPEISGDTVVWSVYHSGSYLLRRYDITQQNESTITMFSPTDGFDGFDIDGDVIVWSSRGDILGYDLKQSKQFFISRAIGRQTNPRISGNTVVWLDDRNSGVGKYEGDIDVYGARLEPGPAPIPPIIGAPSAVDAKIEIVWPQGKPVTDADKANIGTWLFLPGTLNLAPCQFNPTVTLWKATNNGPAKPVGIGRLEGNYKYINGRAVPTWVFNDVDVSAARDPQNKIYFYTTIGDVPSQTNVWAHGVDARTYFPQQDIPTGVKDATGVVDAKIEIVWPQGNLPVEKAQKVNISASLFSPDTLQSVPQDFNSTVHLFRSLNNGIRQEVAVGQKRLVQQGSSTYPVWDFNDVDVSAANDPANKYYFTLSVDGVVTNSNVWSHGADARTYFPQMDTPTQNCG